MGRGDQWLGDPQLRIYWKQYVSWFVLYFWFSKKQKAKIKEGGSGQYQFLKEKVMSLEDNSEDEDYEAAATKRVNEAISSILMEEEEEMGMQPAFVPPEKLSVYFRYTDEGAVREDPEDAAKKEKNKKKRL